MLDGRRTTDGAVLLLVDPVISPNLTNPLAEFDGYLDTS